MTGNQTPAMMRTKMRPTGRRSVRLGAAVVASALVLGSVPVAAHAAFTATSRNASNAFTGALSCGATILADGPSSLYQFDADTGSTVVDSVAPGTANATFKGIRTESTPSCVGDGGKSAVFDGITNSITTPTQSIQAPQTFSYELWFRTTSTLGGKLMSFTVKNPTSADTADDRVLSMLSTGQLRFALTPPYSTADYLTPNVRLNDGNWHHVAVSLSNSGGFQIFVDGKNPNGVLSVKTGPATTGTWVIGTGTSTAWPEGRINNSFQGELDNVAIYNNKPFTLSQAQAHYNAGRVATNRP
ncbi:LamG domain-containing protein [Arthrobacter sp. N199823]|uniref:LamG domain-containing protein n=1 Tax=Arthrobacter sp. N199823 TaxID=2058895 RepID=UPI000CE31685|nr:LamG domain-containing protein [Arthrobacter sp. N199823]